MRPLGDALLHPQAVGLLCQQGSNLIGPQGGGVGGLWPFTYGLVNTAVLAGYKQQVCVGEDTRAFTGAYDEGTSRVAGQFVVVVVQGLIDRYNNRKGEKTVLRSKEQRKRQKKERDAGFWANFRPTCAKTAFTCHLFLQPILSVM